MPGVIRCLPWSALPARTTSTLRTCSRSLRLQSPRTQAKALQTVASRPMARSTGRGSQSLCFAIEPSAALRSELIAEIQELKDPDDLALWAHRRLPAKNTLTADDARAIEAAYQELLIQSDAEPQDVAALDQPTSKLASPLPKAGRKRNKAHLASVAAQACLVCKRSPCDAHHLKFAQPRSLGRKVSDEFTVPLCRLHHSFIVSEMNGGWRHLKVDPLHTARRLWLQTRIDDPDVLSLRSSTNQ